MTQIATLVSGRTQPGKREALLSLFETRLGPRAQANPRQPVVIWLADSEDGDAFHLIEIYTDPAAMEANSKADWFWAYVEEAAPLLNGQPTMRTATPRWAKGLKIG
jgi:quinol monooxygenase YgiN